jgi:multidrug efflux pump subunit AcrA (membrane-fusion protein)
MMKRLLPIVRRPRNLIVAGIVAALALTGFMVNARGGTLPDLPTTEVVSGEFVDTLEIRGEIRPLKSVVLASPLQSGELQIVKLAKNGTMVKQGDVVIEFDGSTLLRTVQEKQSELKQADAEIEQAGAQGRITAEQNATALMKAQYDIDRARLDVGKGDTVSRIENEQAKLVLADSLQKLIEIQEKIKSDKTAAEADVFGKRRKREKALYDLQRAKQGLERLQVRAPAAGMINALPNYRSGGMFGGEQEFREGDRAWPGAAILEMPDLSSIHLEARLEEADRGRLNPGQDATIRIEAVPGRDFKARIDRISLLARADFSSGWPPPRNFDLGLVLLEVDPRIRPGMTAVARISTERVPGVTLVPAEAIFQRDGSPVVYKLSGSEFEEQIVEVSRRGREQAIVTRGVAPGDRVATRRPAADLIRRTP